MTKKSKYRRYVAEDLMEGRDVFRRCADLARQISTSVERCRPYYLGQSKRKPDVLLSEVFDPEKGDALNNFVIMIRFINRSGFLGGFTNMKEYRELKAESDRNIETLRRFAIELAPFLDKPNADKRRRIGRSLKLSVHFFGVAKDRFFSYLSMRGSILYLVMRNFNNEGFGIYVADRLLNDIAKAFEMRERQLLGLSDMPEHSFFSYTLEKKLDVIVENTRHMPLVVRLVEKLTGKIVRRLSTTITRATNETYAGCHHPDVRKDKVVQCVIQYLAKEGVPFSINNACIKIAGADTSGHCRERWLYAWCDRHKRDIGTAVEIVKAAR